VFKFFAWLIGLPVIIICVFFAVSNQAPVTLDLWPTEYDVAIPLYWAVEGALLAGFIIGVFLTSLTGGGARREMRQYRRELNTCRRELQSAVARAERAEGKAKG